MEGQRVLPQGHGVHGAEAERGLRRRVRTVVCNALKVFAGWTFGAGVCIVGPGGLHSSASWLSYMDVAIRRYLRRYCKLV